MLSFIFSLINKKRQVTQIVLGQPARSRFEELMRSSILNRLLRLPTEQINLYLVSYGENPEE